MAESETYQKAGHRAFARPPGNGNMAEYEFRQLDIPRGTSRTDACRILTEQAEYGYWELDRLLLRGDGSRRVVLRRRIIRQVRTM